MPSDVARVASLGGAKNGMLGRREPKECGQRGRGMWALEGSYGVD